MIEQFRRKIRAGSQHFYVTIPKWLVESKKLKIGQEYEFIIRIPEPKQQKSGTAS